MPCKRLDSRRYFSKIYKEGNDWYDYKKFKFIENIDELVSASQEDPLVKLKELELQIKAQESQQDLKESQAKLSVEKEKMENKEKTDKAKIDQQKDAVALRSAIAIEKLERETQQKVLDKAEKMTKNIQDAFNKGI